MLVRLTTLIASICLILLLGESCVPASESELNDKPLSLSDPILQSIYNFQNTQQVDSLVRLFSHPNKFVRMAAAQTFGSMKIPASAYKLNSLLKDESIEVRQEAAYALGQITDPTTEDVLVKSFIQKDSTLNLNNGFNRNILEAIGKVGGIDNLKNIASVSSYSKSDNELLIGQAKSIYRYALRDIYDDKATALMMKFLNDSSYSEELRVIAANYFYRAKQLDIEPYKFQLAKLVESDPSADIRMTCAAALAKTKDAEIETSLLSSLQSEDDYRVKTNIIRALSNYNYTNIVKPMLALLNDPNIHIAQLASEYIYTNGNARDIELYRESAKNNYPWQVQSTLYKAILRHVPNRYINTRAILFGELKDLMNNTKSVYAKAAYIRAMSEDVLNYREIYELAKDQQSPVIKTGLIEGFQAALKSPKWVYAYNTRAKNRYAKGEIGSYLAQLAAQGDAGQLAVMGQLLADPNLNFKSLRIDYNFLNTALNSLELPAELESFNFLVGAINYLQDTSIQQIKSSNTKPIDWTLLNGVTDSTSATIRTSRGDIILVLKPSSAPGTVSNFIGLAQDNFYDGKVFHRVVPNFVAQAGCPRGDGYGSLDYTIRTEVPQESYNGAGKVGMASAGNHTESCQFFITHSPTMHLDGNYSLFAEVIDGLDIVHQIQVGDRIEDVIIHTL